MERDKIFKPVAKHVSFHVDITTYEQLKKQAGSEHRTISKQAKHIIESFFEEDNVAEFDK